MSCGIIQITDIKTVGNGVPDGPFLCERMFCEPPRYIFDNIKKGHGKSVSLISVKSQF